VIGDLRFRQALLQAIDRQSMVDTLQAGVVPIGHSFIAPDQAEYTDVQSRIVRYDYDQRRANQLLDTVGFRRGGDGALLDDTGQRVRVELRASTVDINQKSMLAVADYWQRAGLDVETVTVPPQRIRDQEYVATFPGFLVYRNPNDIRFVRGLHSSRTPLPANNFLASGNVSRYLNPELDALIDRYSATIPRRERMEALGAVVRHVTERVTMLGLFFNTDPVLIANWITNVTATGQGSMTWNAHRWDTRK
jgi:peptide/nickel transport system substrate-binding protein